MIVIDLAKNKKTRLVIFEKTFSGKPVNLLLLKSNSGLFESSSSA